MVVRKSVRILVYWFCLLFDIAKTYLYSLFICSENVKINCLCLNGHQFHLVLQFVNINKLINCCSFDSKHTIDSHYKCTSFLFVDKPVRKIFCSNCQHVTNAVSRY